MTRPAALSGLLLAASASALLGGCVAFDLGPDTDAARAANEAVRGYPRLVDAPPEPEDMHCLRQALAWSASAAGIQAFAAAEDAGRTASSRAALAVFEAPVIAPPRPPRLEPVPSSRAEARFSSVLSSMRAVSRLGRDEEEPEYQMVTPPAPCPPLPGEETARLLAARAYIEEATIDIRADRPAPADGDDIALPEDMGGVARPGEGPEAGR